MDLHGAFADEQPRGDLLVPQAPVATSRTISKLTAGQVQGELGEAISRAAAVLASAGGEPWVEKRSSDGTLR